MGGILVLCLECLFVWEDERRLACDHNLSLTMQWPWHIYGIAYEVLAMCDLRSVFIYSENITGWKNIM